MQNIIENVPFWQRQTKETRLSFHADPSLLTVIQSFADSKYTVNTTSLRIFFSLRQQKKRVLHRKVVYHASYKIRTSNIQLFKPIFFHHSFLKSTQLQINGDLARDNISQIRWNIRATRRKTGKRRGWCALGNIFKISRCFLGKLN